MIDKPQKYYIEYEEKEVIVIHEFKDMGDDFVVVATGDGRKVYRKGDLKRWEDTRWFRRKEQFNKEIARLEENKKKIIEKLKKEAVDGLVARMKINSVFATGKDIKMTQIGLVIAAELEKIIETKDIKQE